MSWERELHTNYLVGAVPLLLLLTATGLSLLVLAYPMFRRYPDDQGDGGALVLLPSPKIPSAMRTAWFLVAFILVNLLYHAVRGSADLNVQYASVVARVASSAVNAPAEVNGYFYHFGLGMRFLAVGTMLALAAAARGGALRRLVLLGSVVWYLIVVMLMDSTLTVVAVVFNIPVSPNTVVANIVAVALGFVALVRMLFANFALPRPTAVPFVPRPRLSDAVTLLSCSFASVAVAMAATLIAYNAASPSLRPLFAILAPIPFGFLANLVRSALLLLLTSLTMGKAPPVGDERPPIEVIIPAYNEEAVIVETLESIDVAAGRYGGPVSVILSNDGSTDRTYELASATMAAFRSATGRIIDVRHGGKSATLNAALAETTAELIVRIDADTLIGADAFYYMPRWFRNPRVGMVEAMMYPRFARSPFPRLRLFEELKQFGLLHRTMQVVDGINVVPGVFTGFRREAAQALGGFVVGMNGEDGDFTMRMSRRGWLIRQDPKMMVYEDVPPTYLEIREQRIRWDRASIHNQARHGPYRAGIATPKVWFSQTHQFYTRVFSPIRLTLVFYLGLFALFEGTWRAPVLLFAAGYVVATMSFAALQAILTISYGVEKRYFWILLWPWWQFCLTLFSVEALLSLPGRPASFTHGSRPVEIAQAVVH